MYLPGLSAQENKPVASSSETFPVKVTYLEGEKIVPNAKVYFLYYDEKTSTLVDKTTNTGDGKTVSFDVPLDDEGASYSFIVFSNEDVAKARKLQADGGLGMYRKPPGEECDYLEFRIQKGGEGTNQGCAIQITVK